MSIPTLNGPPLSTGLSQPTGATNPRWSGWFAELYKIIVSLVTQANKTVYGVGGPEGTVAAELGTVYINEIGGAGTTMYVKETGSNTNQGWSAK